MEQNARQQYTNGTNMTHKMEWCETKLNKKWIKIRKNKVKQIGTK